MAQLVQFVLLLHIVTAIMMLAGWIGRQITRAQIAKATNIQVFQTLTQLSGRFESWLVIPGSLLVFVFGLLIAWLRGWPILGFLQGASSNWLLVSLILYLAVYPLVIFVFLPHGKVFGKALDEALVQGRITPELTAAFHDRAVWLAHVAEAILSVAIIYLMVMKPF